ncbi:MAG: hypothetical protein HZC54_12110 [Verrucomicrobia bacterium]|nr:hypothetical protein [Verrucomicrobiota bacterium]
MEAVPPPPTRGIQMSWQRDPRGGVQRAENLPAPGAAQATAASVSPPPDTAAQAAAAAEPFVLPAAPAPWKFRLQTSAWADAVAAQLRGAVANKQQPVIAAAERMIRGALMHRDVFRDAAQRPELNIEAFCAAAAIVLFGSFGLNNFANLFSSYGFGMLTNAVVARGASWVCAVFAIQAAAKAMHQIELPPAALFRALIYSQVPLLLALLPGLGSLLGLWAAVCAVAALHDLTGRDTIFAVILAVVGGVASSVGAYLAGMVLR